MLKSSSLHVDITLLSTRMQTFAFLEILIKMVNAAWVDRIKMQLYQKHAYCPYYSTIHLYPITIDFLFSNTDLLQKTNHIQKIVSYLTWLNNKMLVTRKNLYKTVQKNFPNSIIKHKCLLIFFLRRKYSFLHIVFH